MKIRPLFLLALVSACSRPEPTGPAMVEVQDAWCRATPAGAAAAGCFVTLTASRDDRLIAVETSAADHAEIHTMSMDGGVMRMRRLVHGLPLPAGVAVALKPGGEHLMIIGPRTPLAAGGETPLILRFEHAPDVALRAPMRPASLSAPAAPPMTGMGR